MASELDLTRRRFLQAAASVTTAALTVPDPALAEGNAAPNDPVNRGSRIYAEHAKTVADVLQTRWFRSKPFSKWGDEQNGWNSHSTLEALIDTTEITGDRRFVDIIRLVAGDKALLANALNDGVDDVAWAGIAHVKAYRLLHERSSLDNAEKIFAQISGYWDATCEGGVWWDLRRTYKNAITNELFLVLAGMLYQMTQKPSYLRWAHQEWNWFARSGMINGDSLINDGLNQCRNNGSTTWTYNQGVILGGLTELFQITKEKSYLGQASRIASATIRNLTTMVDGVAILKEPGGVPNADQQQFKGIFVRYLARLTRALPRSSSERRGFTDFILTNANVVWKHARSDVNEINVYWDGGEAPPLYNGITQTSGLDLLNAAALLSK